MISADDLLAGTNYADPRLLQAGPYAGHWAHVAQMLFTCAVMVSSSTSGNPITRWCYHTRRAALAAIAAWDGTADPPGEWIKRKPENISRPPCDAHVWDYRRYAPECWADFVDDEIVAPPIDGAHQ
jgi:hypothetical protein